MTCAGLQQKQTHENMQVTNILTRCRKLIRNEGQSFQQMCQSNWDIHILHKTYIKINKWITEPKYIKTLAIKLQKKF